MSERSAKPVIEARRLIATFLLVALASGALLSIVGGVVVILERRGVVTLRRVPSPALLRWTEETGDAVAMVNADATPGSFALTLRGKPGAHQDWFQTRRVWIPARSIVLQTCRGFGHPFSVSLHHGPAADPTIREQILAGPPQLAARGSRLAIWWKPETKWLPRYVFIPKTPGVTLVRGPTLAAVEERMHYTESTEHPELNYLATFFTWDGNWPIMVDVDSRRRDRDSF